MSDTKKPELTLEQARQIAATTPGVIKVEATLEVHPDKDSKTARVEFKASNLPVFEAWHLAEHLNEAVRDFLAETGGLSVANTKMVNTETGETVVDETEQVGSMPDFITDATKGYDPKKVN